MNKKNKIIILSLFILICISLSIILLIIKKDNKNITGKSLSGLAVYVSNGTDYEADDEIPTGSNYSLNTDLSYCKGNGEIGEYDSTNGTISFEFTSGDSCYIYFDFLDIVVDTVEKQITFGIDLDNNNIHYTLGTGKSFEGECIEGHCGTDVECGRFLYSTDNLFNLLYSGGFGLNTNSLSGYITNYYYNGPGGISSPNTYNYPSSYYEDYCEDCDVLYTHYADVDITGDGEYWMWTFDNLGNISFSDPIMLFSSDLSSYIDEIDSVLESNDVSSFHSGSGTSSDPYIISNGFELLYLTKEVSLGETFTGIYFQLSDNIYIGIFAKYWIPIGISSTNYFDGILDGNNKTIEFEPSGFANALTFGSLFGILGPNSVIKNFSYGFSEYYAYNYSLYNCYGYYAFCYYNLGTIEDINLYDKTNVSYYNGGIIKNIVLYDEPNDYLDYSTYINNGEIINVNTNYGDAAIDLTGELVSLEYGPYWW